HGLEREGRGRAHHVRLVDVDTACDGGFRIGIERHFHQRLRADDRGRRALHHGDVRAGLPQIDRYVVTGTRRADHHDVLPGIFRTVRIAAGVQYLALETG